MAQKKELRRQFEAVPVEAGIYEVQNTENQKIFIGKTPNLKTLNGMKHILNMGANNNKELQADWNHFGQDAFIVYDFGSGWKRARTLPSMRRKPWNNWRRNG
ncbi:MAG: GIY-YIG nuclease family protein [Trichococcus flocculiformis]